MKSDSSSNTRSEMALGIGMLEYGNEFVQTSAQSTKQSQNQSN